MKTLAEVECFYCDKGYLEAPFSLDCSGYPCLTTRLQRLSSLWYRVAGTQRALVGALVGRQDSSGKRD